MQQQIRSWIKYVIFAGIFSTALNLVFLAVPVYMMVVYDRVLFSFSQATLYTLGVFVLLSLVVMGGLEYIRNRMMAQAGRDLVQTMAPRVVAAMHRDAGAVTPQGYDRGLADLEVLRDAVVQGRFFYFLDIPWVLIYLFVLYIMHPLVGLIALAGVAMAAVFQVLLRMLERRRYTLWDVGFATGRSMVETGKNRAPLLPAMGLNRGLAKKYLERYAAVLWFKTKAERFHDSIGAVIRFVHRVTVAGVFTAATLAFFQDEITVGMMFAGVMIVVRIMGLLEQHLSSMKPAIDAANAYKRLVHFVAPAPESEKTELPEPAGAIQVQGLSLAVPGRALIQNISLDLDPGQMLGVIGPCDAGKSVLCRMLAGVWPGSAGEIRLDGALISQWPAEELGRYIGYMPQEPDLVPGTVAENIARFEQDSDEQVIAAARAAGVHDMILKLPQGYDTPIVRSGTRLSAGRRQLISLARALYGTPRFLVMDDPHTFLDDAGLKTLQAAIQALKQQKITTVIVTDRPAILSNMDKLLVIKDGKSAMYGPADTVMSQLANRQQPTHPSAGV
jgi:PrtD family type I secretion system ABC transporter